MRLYDNYFNTSGCESSCKAVYINYVDDLKYSKLNSFIKVL